jgi:Cytochrome C oxidase, cbb3-type, subunit III
MEPFVLRQTFLGFLFLLLVGCVSNERMNKLYAQRCIGCHGLTGKGDGPTAAFLPAAIPDFRETVQRRSVTQIRNIITKGKGIMPAYGPALSGREIQDMVLMVRLLSQLDRSPKWWERFEPLVWAHCTVPWEVVLGYDDPEEDKR